MARRPFRQATPLFELRERDQQRIRWHQRRWQASLVGVAMSGIVAAVLAFAALTGGHDTASAGSGHPAQLAAGSSPGISSDRSAATVEPTPRPTGQGTSVHPAPSDDPTPDPGNPGEPTPEPTPTPDPGPTSLEPRQLKGYEWPLRNGRLTSFFAQRDSGFLVIDGKRVHEGIDVTTFCGDHILAAHDGTVLAASRRFDKQMGFDGPLDAFYKRIDRRHSLYQLPIVVVIDDGNGYRSAYVHLGLAAVKVGDVVRAGDLIGYEGASGNASGCHLHYELFRMDGPWMRVAPELVKRDHYPRFERERIDAFRVLSINQPGAPRFVPGIDPPEESPGIGRPTVIKKH